MDQRQSAQHPFSRPQPLPLSRDVRYAPIPPPPYSSQQLPARQELAQQPGSFLHPRNEIDRTRTPPATDQNRLYRHPMTSQYPPNPFSAAHSPVAEFSQNHARHGSKGSGAEYGNGSADRYKAYGPEGTFRPFSCLSFRSFQLCWSLARGISRSIWVYFYDSCYIVQADLLRGFWCNHVRPRFTRDTSLSARAISMSKRELYRFSVAITIRIIRQDHWQALPSICVLILSR